MALDHWNNRILCADESCIGTIGKNGKCRECGRKYSGKTPDAVKGWEEAPDAAAADPDDGHTPWEDTDGEYPEGEDSDGEFLDGETDGVTDDEWAARQLCRDEGCIGVIGPDGRCKECGLAVTDSTD